jgi:peptidoglycan/LPS O-acetylase OafA/YrhL
VIPETQDKRLDIQQLRGVAITLVVVYHLDALPGGFIGVDLFFSISGFVITRSLLRRPDGPFWGVVSSFWRRRIRRIYPPLVVTIAIASGLTLLFGSIPADWNQVTKTGIAALLSASNLLLYWEDVGYFSQVQDQNILLHTWSLSLEEQFYVLLPLILLGMSRFSNKKTSVFIAVLVLTSFGWRIAGIFQDNLMLSDSRAVFYLLPARAWQFLVGVLVAILPPISKSIKNRLVVWSAILLGCLSAVLLASRSDSRAILAAQILVSIVVCVVAVSPDDLKLRGPIGDILKWLGDISYSLYLVHWPVIISISAITSQRKTGSVTAFVISLFSAVIMRKTLERPYPSDSINSIKRKSTHQLLLGTSIAVGILAVPLAMQVPAIKSLNESNAFAWEKPTKWCNYLLADNSESQECVSQSIEDSFAPRIYLVGDSHAAMLARSFLELAPQWNIVSAVNVRGACPFVSDTAIRFMLSVPTLDYEGCAQLNTKRLQQVEQFRPDVLVIVNRGHRYIERNFEWNGLSQFSLYESGLKEIVQTIQKQLPHLRVLIIDPLPEHLEGQFEESSPSVWSQMIGKREKFVEDTGFHLTNERRINRSVATLSTKISVIDLRGELCDEAGCTSSIGWSQIYGDDNHLTNRGGAAITTAFFGKLSKKPSS